MMLRFVDVLMDRIRSLQLRRLSEHRGAAEDVALMDNESQLDPRLRSEIRARQNLQAVVFFVIGGYALSRNRTLGFAVRNALIWPLRCLPVWLSIFFCAFSAVMLTSGWLWKKASDTYAPSSWLRVLTGWWR